MSRPEMGRLSRKTGDARDLDPVEQASYINCETNALAGKHLSMARVVHPGLLAQEW
jgi:hypothetical protein